MKLHARIFWFLFAGLTGFAVDAGVLMLLIETGLDPRLGRLVSIFAALMTTWAINRRLAFGDRVGPPSLREFLAYCLASGLAALINLGVFTALVTWGSLVPRGEIFTRQPIVALIVATGISMSFNFWSYLTRVFKPKQDTG